MLKYLYFVHLKLLSCYFVFFQMIHTTEETLLRNVHQNVIYPDPGYWISTWNSNDWEKCCVWRDLVQSSVSIALSCRCSMLTEVTQIGRVEAVRGSVPRVGGLNFHMVTLVCAHCTAQFLAQHNNTHLLCLVLSQGKILIFALKIEEL